MKKYVYSVSKTAACILIILAVAGATVSLVQESNGGYVWTLIAQWPGCLIIGCLLAVVAGIAKYHVEESVDAGEVRASSRESQPSVATTKPSATASRPRDITYRTCENCCQSTDDSQSNCTFCGVRFSVRNIYAYVPSATGARSRTCPNGHTFAVGDLPFCPDCGCDYSSAPVVELPSVPPATDKPVTKPDTEPSALMQMPSDDDL